MLARRTVFQPVSTTTPTVVVVLSVVVVIIWVPIRDFQVPIRDFQVPIRDFQVPIRDFRVPIRDALKANLRPVQRCRLVFRIRGNGREIDATDVAVEDGGTCAPGSGWR